MEDKYYLVLDPLERKEILREEMTAGTSRKLELKQQLFDMRYQKKKTEGEYADRFLDLWVKLLIFSRDIGTFSKKGAQKDIRKLISQLKIVEFKAQGDEAKAILYDEMLHLVKTFISTCETDRTYSRMVFGFISLKKDQLLSKIGDDVQAAGIMMPEELGFSDELSELRLAARSCLDDISQGI